MQGLSRITKISVSLCTLVGVLALFTIAHVSEFKFDRERSGNILGLSRKVWIQSEELELKINDLESSIVEKIRSEEDSISRYNESLEARYQEWLKTYTSPNPSDQAFCRNFLKNLRGSAQFKQDLFLFHNFFKYWPMSGRKGFYIESGANAPRHLSNTFAFDRCLGWEGLCIEPNPVYHKSLSEERTCKIIPLCISDQDKEIQFVMNQAVGHVALPYEVKLNRSIPVKCSRLEHILQENGVSKNTAIDFWVLDVEGHELEVLKGVNFESINVSSILIENNHISKKQLDKTMSTNGFTKIAQLKIDGYFIRNDLNYQLDNIHIPLL
jgi:FkbM family methyltransferase